MARIVFYSDPQGKKEVASATYIADSNDQQTSPAEYATMKFLLNGKVVTFEELVANRPKFLTFDEGQGVSTLAPFEKFVEKYQLRRAERTDPAARDSVDAEITRLRGGSVDISKLKANEGKYRDKTPVKDWLKPRKDNEPITLPAFEDAGETGDPNIISKEEAKRILEFLRKNLHAEVFKELMLANAKVKLANAEIGLGDLDAMDQKETKKPMELGPQKADGSFDLPLVDWSDVPTEIQKALKESKKFRKWAEENIWDLIFMLLSGWDPKMILAKIADMSSIRTAANLVRAGAASGILGSRVNRRIEELTDKNIELRELAAAATDNQEIARYQGEIQANESQLYLLKQLAADGGRTLIEGLMALMQKQDSHGDTIRYSMSAEARRMG